MLTFKSYTEELRYVHKNGWLPADISISPKFWINLEKPFHFEEREIIDTIVRMILSNLDFRILLRDFR